MPLKARPLKKPSNKFDSPIPPPEGADPDWLTKIAIAKMVGEAAKNACEGKPIGFKKHRWGPY